MTPEQYQKFKLSLKETQERSARMIERMDKTIAGVKETIEQIQENDRNIQKMKKMFGDVMEKLARKIAGSFQLNPFKKIEGKTYDQLPQHKPVKEVAKSMMNYKEILIITGAGVSAPSGIPTFRGSNGLYSKKFEYAGKKYEPQEFITKAFYEEHPDPIWEWIDYIYQMSTTLKPNSIHQLIDKFAKALSVRGKKVTLVTQNIDDLHFKPQKQQYEYYAIHGNVKQVRCENNHLFSYADYRKDIRTEQKRVRCPKCQELLRPHVLFFDESYGPLYGGQVKQKEFPFVFVIGSSLSTGLVTKLTLRGKEVVQINPDPVIEVGKVYQFKDDTVKILNDFMDSLGEKK